MSSTITSPSGRTLHHRATGNTTPHEDAETKVVRKKHEKDQRLAENREYLKDANVQAFLKAITKAEGGGYDFMYGAIKGKKNDPWRFTDFSTHPGAGYPQARFEFHESKRNPAERWVEAYSNAH